jgi:DGQHR domain-containing protein
VLPNALIIAFNQKITFRPVESNDGASILGHIEIPVGSDIKPGWVVDGQQRLAALRQMTGRSITVPVTAIESLGVEDEREQFVLINNTRPLPKSLVYELLPSLGDSIPPKFRLRQAAYNVLEILATEPDSPFHGRIKTTTSTHLSTANIKDVSVLRMIENSVDNGVLSRVGNTAKPQAKVLIQYWNAVRELFSEAWSLSPRESRLTHGAGIISMGYLMDAIAFRLKQSNRNLATHNFRSELEKISQGLAWTNGSWELGPGVFIPWKEIQNTGRHIDLITNYLIRKYKLASEKVANSV